MRIAVIGHVEHVTVAAVPALPAPGDILHLDHPLVIAAGGGGIAFFQFTRSRAELHLFTALGDDEAARAVEQRIVATGARVYAARRGAPHTRDLVLVTPDSERTIVVVGEPLHPRHDDALPWDTLAECDAVYFTAQDPHLLKLARRARLLVVTARRIEALARSGVRADVVVGSAVDPREAGALDRYPVPPGALIMTDGPRGGTIEVAGGIARFAAPASPSPVGAYGAGDTFAAALTWYIASGRPLDDACTRAARHGAAVLRGLNPLDYQLPLT
ncbi:MAG TPA: PfkB family carbohydrate kinase [Dehalococcoidia bacterium]|nr:PfkB family carbohydrate kinase [Dehalococcoidia bacterium]